MKIFFFCSNSSNSSPVLLPQIYCVTKGLSRLQSLDLDLHNVSTQPPTPTPPYSIQQTNQIYMCRNLFCPDIRSTCICAISALCADNTDRYMYLCYIQLLQKKKIFIHVYITCVIYMQIQIYCLVELCSHQRDGLFSSSLVDLQVDLASLHVCSSWNSFQRSPTCNSPTRSTCRSLQNLDLVTFFADL